MPAATTASNLATGHNMGRVTQIIGSTFDAQFPEHSLPAIYNAVRSPASRKASR